MGSVPEPMNQQSRRHSWRANLVEGLDQAIYDFTVRHPRSKRIYDEACNFMPGGNTRTVLHVDPFPLAIQSGQSCYLTTADNHTYVDFLGEYTTGIFGHNNPIIRKAIEEALDDGWNYGGPTGKEQQLARLICERFPPLELLRFVNSGTEANMMALATAVAYTDKEYILIFNGGYHGSTISGKVQQDEPNTNLPHKFIIGVYNDIHSVRSLMEQSPEVRDNLAAILVEPMIGSGGCFPADKKFLHYLQELAIQCNAILIFDEVMTSRLAYHGLGHEHGVKPDLMTLGKWIGGGMSFGAFGGRADLMQMYDPRSNRLSHPGTFNNNVFTMTAGIAGCEILTETRLSKLNALGSEMQDRLRGVFRKYKIQGRELARPLSNDEHSDDLADMYVTGMGSMMQIHFGGDHSDVLSGLYYYHMLESGIYMARRGFIALSLEIDASHVDKFVKATDVFCQRWLSDHNDEQ